MRRASPVLEIKIFRDRDRPDDWRVEAFDRDGACHIAQFSGPNAEEMARQWFAWSDHGRACKR